MNTIGERITEGLRMRDMIQADLVEKTGLAKSAISSYINGKYEPKQQAIYLMAKALQVSEAWLLGYDVPAERTEAEREYDESTRMPNKDIKNKLLYDFKTNPDLKILFSLAEDLSDEDIKFLTEMAKRMKGE